MQDIQDIRVRSKCCIKLASVGCEACAGAGAIRMHRRPPKEATHGITFRSRREFFGCLDDVGRVPVAHELLTLLAEEC